MFVDGRQFITNFRKAKFFNSLKVWPSLISLLLLPPPCSLGSALTVLLWILQVPSCLRAFVNKYFFIIWNIQPIFSYLIQTQFSDLSIWAANFFLEKAFLSTLICSYMFSLHTYLSFVGNSPAIIVFLFVDCLINGHLSHQMRMGTIIFLVLSTQILNK